MEYPELHRQFEHVPSYGSKPPAKPGGTPRKGDLVFHPIKAYLFIDGKMTPTTIWEKPNQNFSAYATPFEKQFSKLVSLSHQLDPVVDSEFKVIGHVGMIDGGSLLIPRNIPNSLRPAADKDVPAVLLREEIPFFVGTAPPDTNWIRFAPKKSGEGAELTVLTSIDGQVLGISSARITGQGAVPDMISPTDILYLAKGIVDLGIATGRFMVKSLSRRAASRAAVEGVLLAGPTKELAALASRKTSSMSFPRTTQFIKETGMPIKHFEAFQAAAKEAQVVVIVRNNKLAASELIAAGCPGKPMFFKFKTSPTTGILTATTESDIKLALDKGYYVVGPDRIARRQVLKQGKMTTETLDTKNAFWTLEPGQVIDPVLKKPVVGDYDLHGVFSMSAPGRNIALATRDFGKQVEDINSPIVKKFSEAVNRRLDQPRVLHGAQDQYAGFSGGGTAFHPDGTVTFLKDQAAVEQFYASVGRLTREGKVVQPAGVKTVDELAARRAAKSKTQ